MSFNTRITSGSTYNIVAKQPDCDVTNYDEWVASTGNRNYRTVDDYYDANPTVGDNMTGAGTDTQLFGLANLAAVTTIEAIQIWFNGPLGGGKFLVWVDGEDSVERTAALTISNTFTDALTPSLLTPGGAAWTSSNLDDLFAGFIAVVPSRQCSIFGVEVLGTGLTKPADNPDSDNADCAAPSGPAATGFVPQVMVY